MEMDPKDHVSCADAAHRCRKPLRRPVVVSLAVFTGGKGLLQALLATLLLLFIAADARANQAVRLFRIGTGGATGVYHPLGKLIALGLTGDRSAAEDLFDENHGIPGYIGVAQNSAGSVDNVRGIVRGDIEAGFVQADVAAMAFRGEKSFSGEPARSLRAIASLYPEKLQIVTRADAAIRRIEDFKGKHISIDEPGSGTLAVMKVVLAQYGLRESDFSPVYLKPVFTLEKMLRGDLHGFAMMGGVPMEAVMQLSSVALFMVPVAPEAAARIHAQVPYLVPAIIPKGTYPGIDETPTVEVYALLAVDASCDTELVYRATRCLWSDRVGRLLQEGHPQGAAISLENALKGVSIPLHEGAERLYREVGRLP
jgi:hypothetical protein